MKIKIFLKNMLIYFFHFRDQFMQFNVYLGFVQYLQFTYQKGCLYRLRSLGERNDMDITIDGFHSWMWKGKYVRLGLNEFFYKFLVEFHCIDPPKDSQNFVEKAHIPMQLH